MISDLISTVDTDVEFLHRTKRTSRCCERCTAVFCRMVYSPYSFLKDWYFSFCVFSSFPSSLQIVGWSIWPFKLLALLLTPSWHYLLCNRWFYLSKIYFWVLWFLIRFVFDGNFGNKEDVRVFSQSFQEAWVVADVSSNDVLMSGFVSVYKPRLLKAHQSFRTLPSPCTSVRNQFAPNIWM